MQRVDAMMSYFYDILDEQALPPLQVGVWIPKAKMGPEADNFRPLGMPNTLDRLVDGTLAAQVMQLHPSQTVMSMFKEPQRAVTGIQNLLDSNKAACSLLADLSKAFERVNPYWILRLLRIKTSSSGCSPIPNLSFSTGESLIRYKDGCYRAALSCKVLIWDARSRSFSFALQWILFFAI